MQKFVNNWSMPVELAAGVETLAVGLPAGTYRITMADAAGASATRWEVVGAVVAGGVATLQRGLEGTTDQAWPEGSVMYIGVTAEFLEGLQQAIAAQQLQINDLLNRVAALEAGNVPANALVDANGEPLVDSGANILSAGDIA